jgi:hypothetical protein
VAGEIHGVRADAAANFEDALVLPSWEFGEARDVRLHKIFSALDFVKILTAAGRLGRVANIARPAVPVILDLLDRHLFKRLCGQRSSFGLAPFAKLSDSAQLVNGASIARQDYPSAFEAHFLRRRQRRKERGEPEVNDGV